MDKFYKGKKVFVTGHTGFKGTWMCQALLLMGADVLGYSLEFNPDENKFYKILNLDKNIISVYNDIRNLDVLKKSIMNFQPDIVIHMAAQPLVIESYNNPIYTYETNVMGTVNVLEAVRHTGSVKSFLNVTTDKVYKNKEWCWGYREYEELDGYDPYSNSKSCSELITNTYNRCFFYNREIGISKARAGNVIGGGDFSENRIIPDCVKFIAEKKKIEIRNPGSIRPYQHVLEPIFSYLMIAKHQFEDEKIAGIYNIGPDEDGCISTEKLVQVFCEKWGYSPGWNSNKIKGYHEATYLKLDCSKLKNTFGWNQTWDIDYSIEKTVEWYKNYFNNQDIWRCTTDQINKFKESFLTNNRRG